MAFALWHELLCRAAPGPAVQREIDATAREGARQREKGKTVRVKLSATDPREVMRRTIGYLRNNQDRMDYVAYRKQRLPATCISHPVGRVERNPKRVAAS
jgi:hypothetical protein